LQQHADATHKLVFGHHPIHPVNGFSGEFQREVGPDYGRVLWDIFVKHRVFAYVCSHILAFDVQVHDGVLQLLTAGAGTRYRMPEGIEYLHAVQAALDEDGLRYQVLDVNGRVREKLQWPFPLPDVQTWHPFPNKFLPAKNNDLIMGLSISGQATDDKLGHPQTLLCGWENQDTLPTFWLGLRGAEQRLSLLISPEPGRSPHLWLGPVVSKKRPFAIQIAIHMGMGPGGMLWRWDDNSPWSSMRAASPWGAERLHWPRHWQVGTNSSGSEPFRGANLRINQKAGTSSHLK
ncbi:MAG: hypothetical protein AAF490_26950, partial [Chloroflexota bacterium]